MERISLAEKIYYKATEAGVRNSRVWYDQVFDNFPAKGTFVGWSIERFNTNPYLAIHVNNGAIISISFLQSLAYFGKKENIELKKVTKVESQWFDCYMLSNLKAVNPNLSGDQAEVIAKLLNRNFTSEKISGWIIPYGEFNRDEKATYDKIIQKEFIKINLL